MKITIQPDANRWVAIIDSQPTRHFGTKDAALEFVMAISSVSLIQVIVLDVKGTVTANVTLNTVMQ